MSKTKDYLVTVCAECLCASCWHGEFPCDSHKTADTMDQAASFLRTLKREHPSYYSRKRLLEVCGDVRDV